MIPLLANSQNTYNGEIKRGEVVATKSADSTTIILHANVEDGLLLLEDLLDYEIIRDSVIPNYARKTNELKTQLSISLEKIQELMLQNKNLTQTNKNNEEIIANVKEMYNFKDLTIDEMKNKRKTDNIIKTFGGIGAGVGGVGLGIMIGFFIFNY